MKKIISLFQRNYDGDRLVRNETVPGAEWVASGEGVATRKYDGTCCMIKNGVLYKRYMVKAAKFFVKCLNANATHKAVENPVPHGYAMVIIKQKYSQIIQPWQFGHGETKATCLWLCNLPLLQPSNVVAGRSARIYKMSPGPDRGWLRSVTYTGIAQAMADQWGAFISRSRA